MTTQSPLTEIAQGLSQNNGQLLEKINSLFPNLTICSDIVTFHTVNAANKNLVDAVDRWALLSQRDCPQAEVDKAWAHVQDTAAVLDYIDHLHHAQYLEQYSPNKSYPAYLVEAEAQAREAMDNYLWLIENKINSAWAHIQARDEVEIYSKKADEAWQAFQNGDDHLPIPF